MYDFLNAIPSDDLVELIEVELSDPDFQHSLIADRDVLYRALFSIYSYNILSEKSVRRLILNYCTDEEFNFFINSSLFSSKDISKGRLENILKINTLNWTYKSKLVKLFKRAFKINGEYLPKPNEGYAKFEVVPNCKRLDDLFDYQNEISESIKDFILGDKKSTIVQMPTGSGKTRTLLDSLVEISHHIDIKVVWLAHSEELLEQSIETLKKVWGQKGSKDLNISRLWGSMKFDEEHLDQDYLFSGYIKFSNLLEDQDSYEDILSSYNIFIVDEAHKSVANKFGQTLKKVVSNKHIKLIGLTATPGRSVIDNTENKKLVHLYKNIITSNILGEKPISFLQSRGILSNIIPLEYKHGVDIQLSDSDINQSVEKGDISSKVLKCLGENQTRNTLIVKYIKDEFIAGNKTIVFCCNVEHSKKLAVMLAQAGVIASSVDYRIKPNARKNIVDDFKNGKLQVLLNFGIFSTGLDVPDINTVFITRPTSSIVLYSQMIGRGLRGERVGGTENCRLINVKDNFLNYGDIDSVYNYFEKDWN